MRQILFRGKRVDNGEWVEGFYEQTYTYDTNKQLHRILWNDEQTKTAFCADIIPETLGQFTGLTDKNGKKIFEGDILNMHGGCDVMDIREYDIRVKVVYGRKGYGAEIGFTGAYNRGMQTPLMCEGALTVIGNIHDNPELLTAERVNENENQ